MITSRESKVESRETQAGSRGSRVESREPSWLCPRPSTLDPRPSGRAFTLLEVLIAVGIFFLATFTILELVTRSLRAARSLQLTGPTPGMVAAELTVATNKLQEGVETGDFGNAYPDYRWERETRLDPEATNGLYQVDITVFHNTPGQVSEAKLSILLWDQNWNAAGAGARRR